MVKMVRFPLCIVNLRKVNINVNPGKTATITELSVPFNTKTGRFVSVFELLQMNKLNSK